VQDMTRKQYSARPCRESLGKRLGRVARQIAARDGHMCVYCGATAESSGSPLHLDHLTPRSKGGEDVATNLVLACRSCNCRRHNMPLSHWASAAQTHLRFTSASIRRQARRVLPVL